MAISIFLSYPKPCFKKQQLFVDKIYGYLSERGFEPRTLGVTDYDMDAPLTAIRRLMLESNGVLTIAFRRCYIENGTARLRTDVDKQSETPLKNIWLTTPWRILNRLWRFSSVCLSLFFVKKTFLQKGCWNAVSWGFICRNSIWKRRSTTI